MGNYSEISLLLERLKPIIDNQIVRHPAVKSAIKAKNGTIISVNTTNKTAVVIFPFDSTPIILPYNPKVESYLTTGEAKGKQVSVWYYQTIQNGVIMQNKDWSIDSENKYDIGDYVISDNPISPAQRFGGTWEKISDRFLIGAGGKYELGSTGGEETHNHILNGNNVYALIQTNWNSENGWVINLKETQLDSYKNFNYSFFSTDKTLSRTEKLQSSSFVTSVEGISENTANLPPFLAVNIWKKIA